MPTTQKGSRIKEVGKDLVFPDRKTVGTKKKYEEMAKTYENTIKTYRAMASKFHKELLQKKDNASKKKP